MKGRKQLRVSASSGVIRFIIEMEPLEFEDLCGNRSELITNGAMTKDYRQMAYKLLTEMENQGRSLKNRK